MSNAVTAEVQPHTLLEDILAIVIGTMMVSFGILLLRQAGALAGGTLGIAFVLHYLTEWSFGLLFFLVNLPFYGLAIARMGWRFTLKTFIAVSLVSVFTDLHLQFINLSILQPLYATLFGCLLIGLGLIVLFRHKCSLGGVNVLVLYLQERTGVSAGKLQMGFDICILLASCFIASLPILLASIAGAVLLNLVIAMNFKPGRYTA